MTGVNEVMDELELQRTEARVRVTNKTQMYAMLAAGAFGNTIRQYFDLDVWQSDPDADRIATWGVRTLTPGGPCRLNCPNHEVPRTALEFIAAGHKVNISMMVDRLATVTAWLEVWDSPTGLVVEGVEHPDTANGWTWRNSMPDPNRRKKWEGVAARMVLARHLNENDRDDLAALLDRYPDHVVELSGLDRCLGTVPGRRAVVWECRAY